VELLVNGKSVGKQKNPKNPKQRNRIVWKNVSYEDGKVEAIARNAGKVVAKHQLETTGPVAQIIAEPDQEHWKADGIDLQHVLIKAVDAKGRLVSTADDEVSFKVEGPARIVGISNGDICSNELTSDATHRLWKGSTLVILRAGKEAGIVKLSINSRDKTKIVQLNLGK
jgi:beta-galactosidase